MYKELIKRWNNLNAAKAAMLYPDGVQGQGMAFAAEWNRLKSDICNDYDIKTEDFNYAIKMTIMPRIVEDHGA